MTEMIARLAPDATLQQARTEVASTYARMQRDHKDAYDPGSNYRVAIMPFMEALGDRARLTLWLLMSAAAFVLIISAANVVNLTLMRGVRRESELVVRAALGAGVARLRRLLLVENLLLTLMGAILGVGIALGGVRLLASLVARYSVRASEISVDFVVLGFALTLAVTLALLLSYAAFIPREGTLASIVNAGLRRMAGSLMRQRVQRTLVVAQIAVSVVLLAGAGLLTRTMIQLSEVNTGLKTEQVLTVQVPLLKFSAPDGATDNASLFRAIMAADIGNKAHYDVMAHEIRALPGVMDVGLGSTTPLHGAETGFEVKAEGRALAVGAAVPRASFRTADPEYFRSAGIPVLSGRQFQTTDRPGAGRVVIINRALADKLFASENPIGKQVALTGELLKFTPLSSDWRTVVGVVGNTQDGSLDAPPTPAMFAPFAQELAIGGALVIRADSNADRLAAAATRIVRRVVPMAAIEHVLTIAQIKDQSVAPRRLNAELVSALGLLAVLIATVGIAGVLAFSVSARTQEIGIRMSLGADSGRVQRMILGEGGTLLVIGLTLGMAGAFFATGVLRGLLFGVAPHDPATFFVVALGMALIGLGACWLPALRAARIDPAITMRSS
jgi:predicted permease